MISEFDLIQMLATRVPSTQVPAGIGDDAAVLDFGGPDLVLATVDSMVDGIHFTRPAIPFELVGRRAVAVSVSDIAAMGGVPTYGLVALGLPPDVTTLDVERLYDGILVEAAASGTTIVGGNMTATPGPLTIDVTLLGTVPRGEAVLRSGARPGDMLAVTGTLGAAAARRLGIQQVQSLSRDVAALIELLPSVPPLRMFLGRAIASSALAHAMMDVSDGLGGDLPHLCRASNVGAVVDGDSLPVSQATRDLAGALGIPVLELALSGGEDYELLIAVDPVHLQRLQQLDDQVPVTVIGEVVDVQEGVHITTRADGRRPLAATGWRHF